MTEQSLKGRVVKGLFWKLLEQAGYQGIQFLVALLLARLLTKEEYGTVSLIMIFITIANTFVQSGFATALVQRRELLPEDYSSVFWLSLPLSLFCYLLLFLSAPWISSFYGLPVLAPLVRVMGLVLFPGAVISIQTAFVSRNLQFDLLFRATMMAVLGSGAVSIGMAYRGLGVWAMAAQQLLYYFILMTALFRTLPWRPGLCFRRGRVLSLFSFGWKILVSGLLDTLWQNVYGLLIGKRYSSAELGVYTRGEQFPKLLTTNLTAAIQSVLLPAYAKLQGDAAALRSAARRSVRLSAFLVFPMMAGMFATARPMVRLLLTDRWSAAVPYLCLMCVSYAILPIHSINLQLLNAMGHSELFLRLELLKKLLGILILLLSLPYGIFPMLLLKVLDEYLCLLLNAFPNRRLLGYGPLRQLMDMLPALLCSVLMGGITGSLLLLSLPAAGTLLLQIPVGALSYLLLSLLFNREPLCYIYKLLHNTGERVSGREAERWKN